MQHHRGSILVINIFSIRFLSVAPVLFFIYICVAQVLRNSNITIRKLTAEVNRELYFSRQTVDQVSRGSPPQVPVPAPTGPPLPLPRLAQRYHTIH